MHQSCMSSTQPKYLAFISGGEICTRPSRTASPGRLGERRHVHEPLQGQPRLDGGGAAGAVPDRVHVGADLLDDPAVLAQRGDDRRAGLEPVQALERAVRGDHAVLVHDGEHGQVVAAADLEVVRVVSRGDLDRAGAEGRVDVRVGHDRDPPPGERQLDGRCRRGAEYRSSSGWTATAVSPSMVSARVVATTMRVIPVAVADRDELAVVVGVVDLDVGQRGEAARAPVDDPLGAVDQPVVVQPLEDRLDGPGQPLVHGEPLTGPVHGVAEAAHLGQDPAAVLALPLPDPLDERLAAEVVPGQALLGQLALHDVLGGDARRGPCRAATACGSPACGDGG